MNIGIAKCYVRVDHFVLELLQDLLRLVCVVLSVGTHALPLVAKLALFFKTGLIVLIDAK